MCANCARIRFSSCISFWRHGNRFFWKSYVAARITWMWLHYFIISLFFDSFWNRLVMWTRAKAHFGLADQWYFCTSLNKFVTFSIDFLTMNDHWILNAWLAMPKDASRRWKSLSNYPASICDTTIHILTYTCLCLCASFSTTNEKARIISFLWREYTP